MNLSHLQDLLANIFGGDDPRPALEAYQVAARAALMYAVGIALVRIGKNRLIGRSTPLDVLLGFMLGSILARGVTGSASLSNTAAAAASLVAAHWLLTKVAAHNHSFGKIVKGNAHVIVEEGRILPEPMRASHISRQDLDEALRMRGIEDLADVRRAYKERNGEISVIRR